MPVPDAVANFSYSTVATAPVTATAGTSLTVAAGQGVRFPVPPFNVTVWPVGVQPLATNAEIVRVTAISVDTLTIARATEGSTARAIVVGDQIAATITAKSLTDLTFDPFVTPARWIQWRAPHGASLPAPLGGGVLATVGTQTARTVATADWRQRQTRIGYVSAAATGALVHLRYPFGAVTLGDGTLGGFRSRIRFAITDPATVANARMFVGAMSNTAALTNVEPSTFTNCVGVGHGAADTNLKIFFGGSAAQTPIDLGANFPLTVNLAFVYELELFCARTGTPTTYWVRRYSTSETPDFEATGTLTAATAGTQLPLPATVLTPFNSVRGNNITALSVGIDYFHWTLDRQPV